MSTLKVGKSKKSHTRGSNKSSRKYDVCIVGAGPAGLAALSALKEPYTLDNLNAGQVEQAHRLFQRNAKDLEVCVVDPCDTWMKGWNENFSVLDIKFLRSPAMAHPDHFDQNALLAYAAATDRQDELLESGCGYITSLLPLGQSQVGLWKLPSTKLFADFCVHLSSRLPHDYIQGHVNSIKASIDKDSKQNSFCLSLDHGQERIVANAVILAVGTVGRSVVPRPLSDGIYNKRIPQERVIQWTDIHQKVDTRWKRILVIGGGLTAVQLAQHQLRRGKKVILCSRRPLVERHFDIGIEWFDRRTTNKCMADFYHRPIDERLDILRGARGGGSVPPIYMKDLREWERKGSLRRLTGEVLDCTMETHNGTEQLVVDIDSTLYKVDAILLACGVVPDSTMHPLLKQLGDDWQFETEAGLPVVTEDLELAKNLFVLGGLASLNLGPDAGNLMGIKRGASIIANRLDCKRWLRESDVLASRFAALAWDDSTKDEEETADEESSYCSTCNGEKDDALYCHQVSTSLRSENIPIPKNIHVVERIESESRQLLEDEALAEVQDCIMFKRLTEGISKSKRRINSDRLRAENDLCLAHIVAMRNFSKEALEGEVGTQGQDAGVAEMDSQIQSCNCILGRMSPGELQEFCAMNEDGGNHPEVFDMEL